ncbi:unnamed protein product [Pelagomonas calceolata]|uniref:Beta-lactamase-related domain-containing protein n=1 Tax=Pelagomonas calceolata TaxID=35677 RepID=A0A8J2WT21_9STRA|nr:unnamed protein product [Pelagomonas calceolata]
MQDLESHETSGLLNKQSSTSQTQPQRRAVALTIVVALVATTALVNLVPSGRGGGLRATRLEVGAAAADDDAASVATGSAAAVTDSTVKAGSAPAAGASLQDKFAAAFQSILDEEATAWDCAFSVAVKTEGESAALTAGVIDKATGATGKPSDVWAWGSVTKPLTGAQVLHLADEGKFDLDDAAAPIIDEYIQNIAQQQGDAWNFTWTSLEELFQNASVNDITIRQLLAMQAPIPDFDTGGLRDYLASGKSGTAWQVLDSVKDAYPLTPLQYSSTNFVLLGMIVAHFADGLPLEETDQAYYLPSHLKSQLHFGQNGQTASEWTDVKFYDRTAGKAGEVRHDEWSEKPGIFIGWGASDLAASVPVVAELFYEIYGAQTVTKQVDEMLKFHHDPVWGYEYGLATMSAGVPGIPMYGHGGDTYGAESQAHYSPVLKASVVVASNVEIPHESQTKYVNCMAWAALVKTMTPLAHSIRESCNDIGNTVPRDLYRDQNLRKASN